MKHLVHQFRYKDKFLAFDVCSNTLLELDLLSYRALELYSQQQFSIDEIVLTLKDQGFTEGISEIRETIDDIVKLHKDKILFSDEAIPEGSLFGDDTIIKAMCLHVAHDCNLRCNYCFASSGHFGGTRTMLDLETGMAAIDFLIKSSKGRKHLEIDFFGGEPLMNFDIVKQLVEYSKKQAMLYGKVIKLTLTTNGLLLTDGIREYLNNEQISLVLSLDGRKEINDSMRHTLDGKSSYDVIVPNLQKTVDGRDHDNYYLRGTYTSENLDFAEDVKHMRDLGFQYVSVEPVVAPENLSYALTEEHVERIKKEYELLAEEYISSQGTAKEFSFFHFQVDLDKGPCVAKRLSGCGAGHHYVAVTPEGDIYPCHQFVGMSEFLMGNVKQEEGIQSPELVAEFKNTNIYAKELCKTCWARFMCAGGCHANAYAFNKDLTKPYVAACEITKARLEAALYIKAIELSKG
ncbi:thioether cross-link-forming SCIFF peptide maturase [Desulfuribacillus alkaliarsenatis]|uniref:Thioether cross-link-forming SCIFF peptide maturase n=1 Tax=Desulfuribacillus alkaliarsenatis TaxID=766136 RepID=A0A1E5G0H2_9FIRM|nr:thioether cross-link-forming SCIFF peptide maturase [Desulfuribacillus alkaliarsenatis]OEF96336.1 thioether cross-link-forming SCIFF peptide maturase [Desulfuribacillus alkaliarsenatis]